MTVAPYSSPRQSSSSSSPRSGATTPPLIQRGDNLLDSLQQEDTRFQDIEDLRTQIQNDPSLRRSLEHISTESPNVTPPAYSYTNSQESSEPSSPTRKRNEASQRIQELKRQLNISDSTSSSPYRTLQEVRRDIQILKSGSSSLPRRTLQEVRRDFETLRDGGSLSK